MPATARIASQVAAAAWRIPVSSASSLRLRPARSSEPPGTQIHPWAARRAHIPWIVPAAPWPASATRPGATPHSSRARAATRARNAGGSEYSLDRREISSASGVSGSRPVAAASSRSIAVM